MSADAYYATSMQPPPLNVRVNVLWEGRAFEAARVRDKAGVRWLTHKGGHPIFLPLSREEARASLADALARTQKGKPDPAGWAGYHTLRSPEPAFWAPLMPDKWQVPLPPVALWYDPAAAFPVTDPSAPVLSAPHFHTERLSFSAVSDAEAADMAREMEENRKHAHERGGRDPEGEPPRSHVKFWRNPAAISYSPSGQISVHEAEGRLMRALCPQEFGATAAGQGLGLVLMRCMDECDVRALADHEAKYPASLLEPFRPLPPDLADSDTALGWFLAYCARPHHAQGPAVLIHASRDIGLSHAAIGRLFKPKVTGQRVGQIYKGAIADITGIANGKAHAGVTAQAETLAALRERNRRAKRGERARV